METVRRWEAAPVSVRRTPASLGARLLAAAVLAMTACTGGSSAERTPPAITIAAGEPSGVYLRYGEGLAAALSADLPGTDVRVATTSGSVDNIERLVDGRAQIAFSLADTAAEAVPGRGPFRGRPAELRAVARLYTNSLHVVVPADSPVQRVADLRGRRVSVGGRGSGTEVTATRLLAVAGLSGTASPELQNLGVQESADALAAGRLDAFFWSGGLPTSGITQLVDTTAVRLVPTDDLLAGIRDRHGEYFVEQTIPPSVYGTPGDVSTIGVPNLLLVRADLPRELVRRLTASLFARSAELVAAHPEARYLDQRSAITTTPVQLHDGAAAYYRAVKPGATG